MALHEPDGSFVIGAFSICYVCQRFGGECAGGVIFLQEGNKFRGFALQLLVGNDADGNGACFRQSALKAYFVVGLVLQQDKVQLAGEPGRFVVVAYNRFALSVGGEEGAVQRRLAAGTEVDVIFV